MKRLLSLLLVLLATQAFGVDLRSAGIKGSTSGNAACSGCIGEVIEASYSGTAAGVAVSTACGNAATATLPPGDYICGTAIANTTGGLSQLQACVSNVGCNGTNFSSDCASTGYSTGAGRNRTGSNSSDPLDISIFGYHLTTTTAGTLYFETNATYTSGSYAGHAYCIRLPH